MQSIRGIYDGKEIKPLEKINLKRNSKVIITFLDDETLISAAEDNTEKLLELSGTWEDSRSAEEIIKDIYESRTVGKEDIQL